MAKPTQPRKTPRDERAHRNRLLPPSGGAPRVEATGPRAPEPYFVVSGRERSGWRNALAAARKAHPGAWITVREDRIQVYGVTDGEGWVGFYEGQAAPSKGPRYQTRARG